MRLTCANSCFLLGEADARITRLPRIMFKAGRSSGNGGRGPRACPPAPLDFSGMGIGLSVYGGGSRGAFSSDMVAMWIGRAGYTVFRVAMGADCVNKVPKSVAGLSDARS